MIAPIAGAVPAAFVGSGYWKRPSDEKGPPMILDDGRRLPTPQPGKSIQESKVWIWSPWQLL
jgi:hypothetical protein